MILFFSDKPLQKVPQLYTESVKNDNKQLKNIDEHHSISPVHQNYDDDRLRNDRFHNAGALPPDYSETGPLDANQTFTEEISFSEAHQMAHSLTEIVNFSNKPLKEHDPNNFEKGKFTSNFVSFKRNKKFSTLLS